MTVARLTKRRNRLEKVHQQVLDDLIQSGLTQAEVAVKYKVTPAAISEFVKRHSVELLTQTEAIEEAAKVYRITVKTERIADAQAEYDKLGEWLDEHGLTERAVRYDKDGNEVGETIRLRKDAIDARRQYRREVAEELGALPRPDQNINIKAAVLVRQLEGAQLDDIG